MKKILFLSFALAAIILSCDDDDVVLDANSTLSSIELTGVETSSITKTDVDGNKHSFNVVFGTDVSKIGIKATPASKTTTVSIAQDSIIAAVFGQAITLVATAENKTTTEYQIVINQDAEKSSASLKLDSAYIHFGKRDLGGFILDLGALSQKYSYGENGFVQSYKEVESDGWSSTTNKISFSYNDKNQVTERLTQNDKGENLTKQIFTYDGGKITKFETRDIEGVDSLLSSSVLFYTGNALDSIHRTVVKTGKVNIEKFTYDANGNQTSYWTGNTSFKNSYGAASLNNPFVGLYPKAYDIIENRKQYQFGGNGAKTPTAIEGFSLYAPTDENNDSYPEKIKIEKADKSAVFNHSFKYLPKN